MTTASESDTPGGLHIVFRKRFFWVAVALIGATGLIAANAHLLKVAFASQPPCVDHQNDRGTASGAYRAAKSGCKWREENQE